MIVTIQPSAIHGSVHAPASKSSMQRACAAALLRRGESFIHHPGHSNDDKAALEIIQRLGAKVDSRDDVVHVVSGGVLPNAAEIDCGESGLSIRMFTPIAALSENKIRVTGSGSLVSRPMDFFDEILPQLGVRVHSNQGKLPITLQGPLRPSDIVVDGSLSSQFLTGLLMAFSAAGARDVTIRVSDLKSRPYIDLTLDVMRRFGLDIPENKNYEQFIFNGDVYAQKFSRVDYTVESDWSGGAFLLVAGAIAGPLTITGLDPGSAQADKAILDALMAANAGLAIEAKGIKVRPSPMNGFDFDATDCPDLFPPLVALAAYCQGETRIRGASRLTHKESNRAESLRLEFGKMGLPLHCEDDEMIIQGGGGLKGATVSSHHDHRIAMACAVAALAATGPTQVEDAMAVRKSYPGFYNDLKKLGASVSLPFHPFNF